MTAPAPESLVDDGLPVPEVGDWSEDKYNRILHYATMFATSMKGKWFRVYLDLFSGAGYARIKGTSRIVAGSPFLALGINPPFDRYIFCDADRDKIEALTTRVKRTYPNVDARYVNADVNVEIDRVLAELPGTSSTRKVLAFCVVDPFNMRTLAFDTLRTLSKRYGDFLVLIPSYMDAHRNLATYVKTDNDTVEKFLGDPNWRENWKQAEAARKDFGMFVVEAFTKQMESLRFLAGDPVTVRLTEKNVPIYHLTFFSRNQLGIDFWRKANKSSKRQGSLFE